MDIGYLFRIVARRKWLILAVALACAAAMYFLIGLRPELYRSEVMISTGIVNYKGINSSSSDAFVQEYQVQNAFSNLIEIIQSQSAVKLLTMKMLKHDLGAKYESKGEAFREANPELLVVTAEEETRLLKQLNGIPLDSISHPTFTVDFDYLLDKVARSYGYDNDAVMRSMEVKRKGETDYLTLSLTGETPELAQHMANGFARQFLTYYQNLRQSNNKADVDFYTDLVMEKHLEIDSLKNRLYSYRRDKKLPTYNRQAEELVAQITELEVALQRSKAKQKASAQSVERLEGYSEETGEVFAKETRERLIEKYQIEDKKKLVDSLKQLVLASGSRNEKLRGELASAEADYQSAIRASAKSVGKIRDSREKDLRDDLFKSKVNADMAGVDAGQSVFEIQAQLDVLRPKLAAYVDDDQTIQNYLKEIDRAEGEFSKLNDDLNKVRLEYQTNENPLNIIQNGQLPEWPEANNQVLLSVFAGIVGATLTTILIFLLAYFDSSIQSPYLFKRYTNDLPLMGAINEVNLKKLDLSQVFSQNGNDKTITAFRENLRKLRTDMLNQSGKVYLFVSTKEGEGKTFTMNALAHSLAANGKRVLLIDTNFKNPTLSQFANEPSTAADLINRTLREYNFQSVFELKQNSTAFDFSHVEVLGNLGIHKSPTELLDSHAFRAFLRDLGESFDYIFLEAAAMNSYSDAKELAPFADRIVAVFNSGSVLKAVDQDSIQYLNSLNGKFAGSVLTEVDLKNMHS